MKDPDAQRLLGNPGLWMLRSALTLTAGDARMNRRQCSARYFPNESLTESWRRSHRQLPRQLAFKVPVVRIAPRASSCTTSFSCLLAVAEVAS